MFETTRLHLRAFEESDMKNLTTLFNDQQVAKNLTEDFVVPRGDSKFATKLTDFIHNCLLFAIVETKLEREFVGFTNIFHLSDAKNRNATFGIAFLPSQWGLGYGFETGRFIVDYAFRNLAMHRVSLCVFEGNDRARRLYAKLAFVEEGRYRKMVWIDGKWCDKLFMGILEDEWRATQQKAALAEEERHPSVNNRTKFELAASRPTITKERLCAPGGRLPSQLH